MAVKCAMWHAVAPLEHTLLTLYMYMYVACTVHMVTYGCKVRLLPPALSAGAACRYVLDDVVRLGGHYDANKDDLITWKEFKEGAFGKEIGQERRDLTLSIPPFLPPLPLSFPPSPPLPLSSLNLLLYCLMLLSYFPPFHPTVQMRARCMTEVVG